MRCKSFIYNLCLFNEKLENSFLPKAQNKNKITFESFTLCSFPTIDPSVQVYIVRTSYIHIGTYFIMYLFFLTFIIHNTKCSLFNTNPQNKTT